MAISEHGLALGTDALTHHARCTGISGPLSVKYKYGRGWVASPYVTASENSIVINLGVCVWPGRKRSSIGRSVNEILSGRRFLHDIFWELSH